MARVSDGGESLVEVVDAHGAADFGHGLLADTAGFGGAALPRPAPSYPNGCYNEPGCVTMNHLQCSRLCYNE